MRETRRDDDRPNPRFTVEEPFIGVTVVLMNDEMRIMLSRFIEDVRDVEREIFAFGKALQDPVKGRRIRDEKRRLASSAYSGRNRFEQDFDGPCDQDRDDRYEEARYNE